jgi:hypothetical protein
VLNPHNLDIPDVPVVMVEDLGETAKIHFDNGHVLQVKVHGGVQVDKELIIYADHDPFKDPETDVLNGHGASSRRRLQVNHGCVGLPKKQ